MKFRNPPLIYLEAVCEYRPEEGVEPARTEADMLALEARFKKQFPDWQPLRFEEGGKMSTTEYDPAERFEYFVNPDATIFAALQPHYHSMEFYKPYVGWETAYNLLKGLLAVYENEFNPKRLGTAVLAYRNRIEIPDKRQIAEFVGVAPSFRGDELWDFSNFFAGVRFDRFEGRDVLQIRSSRSAAQPQDAFAVGVDISYALNESNLLEANQAAGWFSIAHEEIGKAFHLAFLPQAQLAFQPYE